MSLNETLSDVAALIPRYSWEIMDEQQKDDLMEKVVLPRYMETTADGVQLGPKAWAEMVGASPAAVKNRVQRLQTSQQEKGATGARAPWTQGQREQRNARAVLRDAPLEQVEQIIAALPKERQQAIGAAAGHEYMKARQEYTERERNLTPADKREREHAREEIARPVRQAVAGFSALGIIGHLEQATDELRELLADGSLTPKVARQIDRASDAWNTELKFALQMVGENDD
jgi:hypothetical protein